MERRPPYNICRCGVVLHGTIMASYWEGGSDYAQKISGKIEKMGDEDYQKGVPIQEI